MWLLLCEVGTFMGNFSQLDIWLNWLTARLLAWSGKFMLNNALQWGTLCCCSCCHTYSLANCRRSCVGKFSTVCISATKSACSIFSWALRASSDLRLINMPLTMMRLWLLLLLVCVNVDVLRFRMFFFSEVTWVVGASRSLS